MKREIPSLSKRYEDFFSIGAAVNTPSIETHQELLRKHFSSITAENEMKPISVNPVEGEYTFDRADEIIKFAKNNKKIVRGHTLVWHNQTSDHIFIDKDSNMVSADHLLERLRKYIKIVFEHFAANTYCWDVVNEAIKDNGSELLRETKWLKILGENYIDMIFLIARDLNTDVSLFYNDYDAVLPEKRDKIYTLLKGMKDRDIPLDGVGIQAHWNIYDFKYDDIKAAIEKYASLDLDIHITELDVSIFSRKERELKLDKPSVERIKKQNEFYGEIFKIFREYKNHISNVTLWGIADDYSWLDYFRYKRKNWPLLFDENHQPKEAFWRILNF